jgi:hypothetical protein
MSEYRNANDPMGRDTPYDLNAGRGSGAWGWIAGAVLIAILVGLAFGVSRTPNQQGSNVANNNAPITRTQPAPAPGGPGNPAFTPAPLNPANPAPAHP